MKKIKTLVAAACLLAGSLFYNSIYAQAPQKFSYQTVVRDASQGLLQNQSCALKISIRSGTTSGTVVYSERHIKSSNINGLVTLEIGAGTVLSGTFNTIDWGSNTYFVQTEIDPAGGTNYTISGTSQLLSVPYALHAVTSKNVNPFQYDVFNFDGKIVPHQGLSWWSDTWNTNGSTGYLSSYAGLRLFTSGVNRLNITQNGNVGIGTSTPNALLDIQGSGNPYTYGPFMAFTANQTNGIGVGVENNSLSILASGRIVSQEVNLVSDERIKNVIGRSNPVQDLNTLLKIQITDYTHKDVVSKGNGVVKKVVAQELEKVYPSAVSKMTDVIPNIYTASTVNAGHIFIKNDLKAGEKVRLLFEDGTELVDVLEATSTSFKVNTAKQGKVFVYGKQVNDFRTVDYDAIAMLNVSATQELFKMITELQTENEKLKIENKNTKASMESIMQLMQTLNAKVNTLENPVTGQVEKK